jgi:LmbE family N-acetylglucosaminyl deacetylase
MVRVIAGPGTDEAAWRAWSAPAGWPPLERDDSGDGPVVVAPHPDDEVLGVGGLLSMLAGAVVVAVTDGEASHPGSTVYGPAGLAAVRRCETATALARLGLDPATTRQLAQPDGHIDEAALTAALVPLLRPGRRCFVTWRGDGHPDHEAAGRAAAAACARTGAVLLEYPVWTWHWACPDHPDVPWARARRIDLSAAARAAKTAALAAFASQIAPIGPEPTDAAVLPPAVLARFARPYEVVFG